MSKQQRQEFEQKIDQLEQKIDQQCNQFNELKSMIEVLSSTVIGQLVKSTPSQAIIPENRKRMRMSSPDRITNAELYSDELVVQEGLQGKSMEEPVSLCVAKKGFQSKLFDRNGMYIRKMLRYFIEYDLANQNQWISPINSDMKSDFKEIHNYVESILTDKEKTVFSSSPPRKDKTGERALETYNYWSDIDEFCATLEERIMVHIKYCKAILKEKTETKSTRKSPDTKPFVTPVAKILRATKGVSCDCETCRSSSI